MCRPVVPNLFGTRDQFRGRQFFSGRRGRGDGSGGNASYGEPWGAADEALLAYLLLTSCCVTRFLTGHGPVPVRGLGVWDPWCRLWTKQGHVTCKSQLKTECRSPSRLGVSESYCCPQCPEAHVRLCCWSGGTPPPFFVTFQCHPDIKTMRFVPWCFRFLRDNSSFSIFGSPALPSAQRAVLTPLPRPALLAWAKVMLLLQQLCTNGAPRTDSFGALTCTIPPPWPHMFK